MRVVLADDHPLILRGIRLSLLEQDDFQIVAEANSGDEALRAIQEHKPDLLIADLSMPGLPTTELITRGREAHPELKVLVLTAHRDDYHLMQVNQVPISGYLLKEEAPEHLLQALRVINQGAAWFSQSVLDRIRGLKSPRSEEGNIGLESLTLREREILGLIGQGFHNQDIAQQLSLAEQTVRNYTSTIYQKLGLASRMEALVWARDHMVCPTARN